MFSSEFSEIFKNTFSYRTPLVAASMKGLAGNVIIKIITRFDLLSVSLAPVKVYSREKVD